MTHLVAVMARWPGHLISLAILKLRLVRNWASERLFYVRKARIAEGKRLHRTGRNRPSPLSQLRQIGKV
jgi:hypothetical protein